MDENAPEQNFYEILQVNTTSNTEVIRRAWKLAAWQHHPDLLRAEDPSQQRENETRMQRINEAYQTLSDPDKRRRYDLEMGLLPARCGSCGADGNLRLSSTGNVVALCAACYQGRTRSTAL